MAARKRPTDQRPEESDGEDSIGTPSSPGSAKRTRIGDFVYDQNDVDDEERKFEELKALHSRASKDIPEKNTPANGGIVKKIICENFMCHDNLEMELGPLTNFVVGHNGSGKSAVLTAFTLCMGGKAAGTNRAASIKDLIKTGSEWARITVVLKNEGDGFKPTQYGDEIRIVRHFTVTGGGGYKVQSKTGKTISSKREELDELCDFYGIQVDNPITVLTQDLAREFLSSASNAKKYEFFAKGVQLEQLDQDYSLIAENIRYMEADLHSKKESLAVLRSRKEDAKKKLDRYEHAQDHERQHVQMQKQMAWAQVVEAEDLLAEKVAQVQDAIAEVERIETVIPDLETRYAEADEKTSKAEEEVKKIDAELTPLEASSEGIKEELQKHKGELSKLQAEERNLKSTLTQLRKSCEQEKAKIQAEEERLAARDGGHNRRLKDDIEKAASEIEGLNIEDKELKAHASQLKDALTVAQTDVSEAASAIQAKTNEIQQAKETLRSIRQDTTNTMSAYSPEAADLIKAIDRENWRQKPIGPIGRCVTLRKQQWESIVEKFFGSTFSAFLCTNSQDASVLRNIIRRNGYKNTQVLVSQGDLKEALREPAQNYDTILRVLEIPDDRVRRLLIIQHGAEQAVLIEDPERGKDVMKQSQKNDNISAIYSLNEDRWGARITKGGVDPVQPFQGRTRMCKSRADEEKSVQNQIHVLENDLQPLQQQHKDAKQREGDIRNDMHRTQKRISDVRIATQKAQEQKEELSATLNEAVADGKLTQLKAQYEATESKLKVEEAHYMDYVARKDETNKQGQAVYDRKKAVDQEIAFCKQRLQDAKTNFDDQGRIRYQYLQKKNSGMEELDAAKLAVEAARGAQQAQQDAVDDIIEQASGVCERVEVPPGETTATLDQKLERSQNYLDALSKELGGSEEELSDAYTTAYEQHAEAKRMCDTHQKILMLMYQTLSDRRERWKQFLQAISARARSQFLFLMSLREFKGRLRLDHTQKELIIEVQPGLNEAGNRGPKGLSGGEKSLSTICLLLSLWEAMGSPIRCLDEFDVFMDPVNRDFSVTMMVEAARKAVGKQFILITPQGMAKIPENDQCKVVKMPEPKRGQGTLDGFVVQK